MSDAAGGMLDGGRPAVDVLTEYVRACRRLGHPTPEPAQLLAAYTAEEGLDLQALDDDGRALTAAVAAAEEAMLLQEHARRILVGAWQGAGAEAAADHLVRHADAASVTVDGLRSAAGALGELRNRLWQLMDAKVGTALDVEARGMRAEWLSAARIVNTGAGDRSGASELVDLQVAPFVADDIAVDWASSLQRTESAIRQAYSAAAAAMGAGATAVFDSPGALEPGVSPAPVPVGAEQVHPPAVPATATAPAGFPVARAAWSDPAPAAPAPVTPAAASAPAMPPPVAPPPPAAALVPDPMAAAPMPPLGGLGGGTSPLGSGLSRLSGAGQPFSDLLGGLLGSGGDALGGHGDLDPVPDDELSGTELGDPTDEEGIDTEADDTEENDTEADGGTGDDETADQDHAPDEGAVVPEDPAAEDPVAEEPVVPAETVTTEVDPPVPTPVPEPLSDPGVPLPAAPADTPCEIAADELPQAGP